MIRNEYLVPASVAVRVFNEVTGAKCKTFMDTVRYLRKHPEARAKLEAEAIARRKRECQKR